MVLERSFEQGQLLEARLLRLRCFAEVIPPDVVGGCSHRRMGPRITQGGGWGGRVGVGGVFGNVSGESLEPIREVRLLTCHPPQVGLLLRGELPGGSIEGLFGLRGGVVEQLLLLFEPCAPQRN